MTQDIPKLGDRRDHYWLLIGMADTCGVNLLESFEEGRIDSRDWAGMVTACQGCGAPGSCRRLLSRVETLPEAPEYCANRDRLAALSPDRVTD